MQTINLKTGNQPPIPLIRLENFHGGRFYNHRHVYGYTLKFPCLPPYWSNLLSPSIYKQLEEKFNEIKHFENVTYKKDIYKLPSSVKGSDKFLKEVYGLTTLQCFNRILRGKKHIAYKDKRVMWCIPYSDCRSVLGKYRSNQFNQSEKVGKELQWLFLPILEQFEDILIENKEPDYSMLDLGPDRKPCLFVCNICSREAIKEEWSWRTIPGLANHHYISHCPNCKTKGTDVFESMFTGGKSEFQPFSKMQDNLILTMH